MGFEPGVDRIEVSDMTEAGLRDRTNPSPNEIRWVS